VLPLLGERVGVRAQRIPCALSFLLAPACSLSPLLERVGVTGAPLAHLLAVLLGLAFLLPTAVGAAPFRFDESSKDYIKLYDGAKPVYRYVRGEVLPSGAPENRRRSTYIDPLYSLDGLPISDDGPKDHWHHRGLSWIWPRVTFDGVTKDLWTLRGVRQRYVKHESRVVQGRAVLKVTNYWEEDSTGRRLLDETVTLTTHAVDRQGRTIDFELQLAAIDTPVSIGTSARGYGGLNIRFAPRKETTITTSEGAVSTDVDRQRYAWADLSARFGGSDRFDGVAILDDRSNPHFPSGWTLRPYGVFNPAFTSTSTDYTIQPGKPLTLRYRIIIHGGKGDPGLFDHMLMAGG